MEIRFLRPLFWGIAALSALAIALASWIYFFFPGEWLAGRISREFEKTTHWNLVLPPISPFPLGRFTLGEVRLEGPGNEPFLRIGEVRIHYRILPLLKGMVSVDDLTIRDIEITLRKEGEEWNALLLSNALFPTPSPPGPLSQIDYVRTPFAEIGPAVEKALAETMGGLSGIRLSNFSIERLRLTVDDGAGHLFVLPPIDLRAKLFLTSSEQRTTLEISLAEGSTLEVNGTPFATALQAGLAADLASGNVDLSLKDLSIPGHLSSQGHLRLEELGSKSIELGGNLRTWPGKFPVPLPEITASVDLKGRLRASSLAELEQKLRERTLPLHLDLRAALQAKGLSAPFLPAGVSVRDFDGRLETTADNENADLHSSLSARDISLPDLPPFDLRHEAKISLSGLRSISIPQCWFELPSFGLRSSVTGKVASTVPFPSLGGIRDLREALTADLAATLTLNPAKAPRTVKGVSLSGTIEGGLRILKAERDRIDLSLEGKGENFSASLPDGTAVENLSFHFPLRKTLFLGPAAKTKSPPPDASLWARSDSAHLYTLSPYANSLRLARVAAKGFEAKNVSLDAGFDGSNLVVDRFSADLLGGSVWGRMTLLPSGDSLKMSAATEVIDLDVSKLTEEPFEGDARVSFDARADLSLVPGRSLSPEGLLDELAVAFHLTKIGDQTLDRLITFLDPKGEDPSMVQARGLLRDKRMVSALKNPRVSFSVSHGMMDADIVLPGVKIVDLTIPIRGISVKNLLKSQGFRKSLADLAPALEAAKYLRLTGIDDEGNFVFSKGAP